MLDENNTTPFQEIYERFYAKLTDDLYLEMTPEETERDLIQILVSAIPSFEFPRFPLLNYDENYQYYDEAGMEASIGRYECKLTREEVDILSDCMLIEWVRRQINSVENTRMKYSGSDFKFTSQANHIDKLIKLKRDTETTNKKKQRLYKRRKIDGSTGMVTPNYSQLAGGVIGNGRKN